MTRHKWKKAAMAADPRCAYCGEAVSDESASVDHVVPVSRGGTNEKSNYALACRRCNVKKGSWPAAAFGRRLFGVSQVFGERLNIAIER